MRQHPVGTLRPISVRDNLLVMRLADQGQRGDVLKPNHRGGGLPRETDGGPASFRPGEMLTHQRNRQAKQRNDAKSGNFNY
jgi:hypothetical protein